MSLKIKLASAIIMFLAVLAALVIGVLAAQSQTINMQGTINFEIADRSLYVKSASIDYGDGQERALDSFMPGYINGSFTANIGEHTITNTNFKICFDIINTTENTYYALEETTLSSELQGKITATASGTINPTTITDFDEEGNAIITPDTETNGRVTLTVSAPSLLTLDLSGITITINEAQELTGFTFRNTSDNTGELYRYNGTETDVVIPSSYSIRESDRAFITGTDYKVTSTYDGIYSSGGQDYVFIDVASNITSITFPETLEKIGDYTLYNCSKLTEIVIPASVTSIGISAFYNCSSLTTVTFENDSQLESIGAIAFSYTSLQSIEIPSSVTIIGRAAFQSCGSLTTVLFQDESQLTSFGAMVFSNCSALQYNENNNGKYLGSERNQYLVLVDTITTDFTEFTINENCQVLGDAFANCNQLQTIEMPEGVKGIGSSAFNNCSSLESIEIPASVTSIEGNAFSYCSSLTTVTFANNSQLENIGDSAFSNCYQLQSIEIPSSVTSIGEYAFTICRNLAAVTFANNSQLENIGDSAFSLCSQLQSIEIPSSVTSIGNNAFSRCGSLTAINVAGDNQNYSSEDGILFNKDKTTLIQYPSGKTEVTYQIPLTVTTIAGVFYYNSTLETIEISANVTSIGGSAFFNCTSLTTVIIDSREIYIAATSQWACGNLLGNSSTTTVRVLKSIVDGGAVNSYITSNFTNTSEDGNYYVYTK